MSSASPRVQAAIRKYLAAPLRVRQQLHTDAAADLASRGIETYRPYDKQRQFHALGAVKRERLLRAGNQQGKALRHGTPVATPDGWRPIEAIRVGDLVVAGDGSLTEVVGVYPQGVKPLYRLTFDKGETIDCCGEHLWLYQPPRARYPTRISRGNQEPNPSYGQWCVGSTEAILAQVGSAPAPRRRPLIPTSKPWALPHKDVPIDPYLLGALLGDGTLHSGIVGFSTADAEIAARVTASAPSGVRLVHVKGCDYKLQAIEARRCGTTGRRLASNVLIERLSDLGAYGHRAHEKRVPREYLLNDAGTRLAVLQGLMDTDGGLATDDPVPNVEFTTVSPGLAEDVKFLVQSFGGRVVTTKRVTHYTYNGERRAGRESYRMRIRIDVCPFRLTRKAQLWRPVKKTRDRVLHAIEPIEADEATCIAVAHPDRTYVTAHGIVTHNTYGGAAEVAMHLTGEYPAGWQGRRFTRPIVAWAASDTAESTRDNPQRALLGMPGSEGTGAIPARCLALREDGRPGEYGLASGTADLYDYVRVKHVSGGWSYLRLKNYAQGRRKWQGPPVDVVWFDEEPDPDIYDEGLARTIATAGIVLLTCTPLLGMSEVMRRFLVPPVIESRGNIQMEIEDAEHITADRRADIIAAFPEHEREARARGIPVLGSGLIFPVPRAELEVAAFAIPADWPRLAALDFGWEHPTAAVWMAFDGNTKTAYVYDCYRRSRQPVPIHASAVKGRGGWIPCAWPRDGLNETAVGEALAAQYRAEGVKMLAKHAHFDAEHVKSKQYSSAVSVEAGLQEMLTAMTTGRFKVFKHLGDWFEECSMYHRKDGDIVKEVDDLMSATRYGWMMQRFACVEEKPQIGRRPGASAGAQGWMAA